jgi:homoserine kinase type II
MATFTALSLAEARTLGERFGLDVMSARPLAAGSVNSSFSLVLGEGEGRAFLRIYEGVGIDEAEREARLIDHLSARGVPTPRPMPLAGRGGGLVTEHAGKPVVIFPWVEGELICQRGVTRAHAAAVGDGLARVHVEGLSFGETHAGRFRVEDLAARLEEMKRREDLPADVAALAPELASRLARHVESAPAAMVPIIHGDLFRDNVLWRGDSLAALLDFESASSGSAAFDLAVTVLAWCFGDTLDLGLARALAEGYAARRPMPEEERAALYDAALFAALRFTITRITDFELRPGGDGLFKDYRRFVARLRAIEAIGPSRWRAALGL